MCLCATVFTLREIIAVTTFKAPKPASREFHGLLSIFATFLQFRAVFFTLLLRFAFLTFFDLCTFSIF